MSQGPQTRNYLLIILKNFINSLKPRQFQGDLKGVDHHGTRYYEIAAGGNKARRSRWFEPVDKEDFEQEIPAEWESWLRGRRVAPPTTEEINHNLQIMHAKQQNATKVNALAGKPTPHTKGIETFPKRPEFEIAPGKKQK